MDILLNNNFNELTLSESTSINGGDFWISLGALFAGVTLFACGVVIVCNPVTLALGLVGAGCVIVGNLVFTLAGCSVLVDAIKGNW